ncbi:MAG TPA: 30S ribosomal protein S8e, partial [Candidatus Thalassarchaeaceae archaeon]
QAHTINISDPKTGKTFSSTMTNIIQNDADPNFVRRNIVTKGAIAETEAGNVRITSRPGMDGVVCGVLLDE